MKRHEDDFLREIFADEELDALRENSLTRGLRVARARRRGRKLRVAALVAVPVAVLAAAMWLRPAPRVAPVANFVPEDGAPRVKFYPAVTADEAPPVPTISDEQLLALFKGRSVALLGSAGRQRLVVLDSPQSSGR